MPSRDKVFSVYLYVIAINSSLNRAQKITYFLRDWSKDPKMFGATSYMVILDNLAREG